MTTPYLFDNRAAGAADMLRALTLILDPPTHEWIAATEAATPGAQCVDLGSGMGLIPSHLSELAGPDGQVVAVDKDPRHLEKWLTGYPNIRIEQRDLTYEPIPAGPHDLIITRSLLPWLPNRADLVAAAVEELKPGGVLMTVDFETGWDRCVLRVAPEYQRQHTITVDGQQHTVPDAHTLFAYYHHAFLATMAARRHSPYWVRDAFGVFETAGLVEVSTEVSARSWRGGEAGCQLPVCASTEAQPALVEAGMSVAELEAFRRILRDPRTALLGLSIFGTWGRRPA